MNPFCYDFDSVFRFYQTVTRRFKIPVPRHLRGAVLKAAVFPVFQTNQPFRQYTDAVTGTRYYIFPGRCWVRLNLENISHHRFLLLSLPLYCRCGDSCDKLFLEEQIDRQNRYNRYRGCGKQRAVIRRILSVKHL